MPFKYNKLKGRIIEKYGSQGAFAEKIGISKNSFSKKMTGKSHLSQTDIMKWSKLLDIQKDQIGDYFFA